jgi:hypothetical protein
VADDLSLALRREIRQRAGHRCEYCRMTEAELLAGCEVDHIISRKHGGLTDSANLALSCERCNRAKGSDIGSVSGMGREFVRLFNPRIDAWAEHFLLRGPVIEPQSLIGEVTARLLRFNAPDRVLQRRVLQQIGVYPVA